MISYEEALSLVLGLAQPTPSERVPLDLALGRVLAEDLVTEFPVPRFDNSAVDGYAVGDLESTRGWVLGRTVAAGDPPGDALMPGECVRIYTGAPTPPACAAVVMQEDVELAAGRIHASNSVHPGQHIRLAGEELRAGSVALPAGTILNEAGLGAAATLGCAQVAVHRQPRLSVVVTGSELIPVGMTLGLGQIYESNSVVLKAALRSLGLLPSQVQTVGDRPEAISAMLASALETSDVLILTGGVSVGDRDLVKFALEEMGVQRVLWKVAIKPGKPVYVGRLGAKTIFGLPGNPLSAFVTFHLFVRPFLKAIMGCSETHVPRIRARLGIDLKHKPGRREFVPAKWAASESVTVMPLSGRASHMMSGAAQANGLIDVPADVECLSGGEEVWVFPLWQTL